MTKYKIFVDTGAWIALAVERDQFHKEAISYFKILNNDKAFLYTSNLIIHETYTFLSRKESKEIALSVVDTLSSDSSVRILHVDKEIDRSAFDLLHAWRDQDFGSVDATSFCLMHANNIERAFTFDSHFKLHNFEVMPKIK